MTRTMYMTDHMRFTGFGYVADQVCNRLGEKFGADQTFLLGWGFQSSEPMRRGNYTLLPSGGHPFGADALPQMLDLIRPEYLITQNDTRMIMDYWPQNLPCTWINYPVVDGYVWQHDCSRNKWPSNWAEFMKRADCTVAMSEFGGELLKSNGVKNTVIPHGVETELFKPLNPEVREKAREQWKLKDKFVVAGVFKNMARKMPDKWLQILRMFKEDKKDVVGLLHTNPMPPEFNMVQHCIDYGLELGKDIMFSQLGIPREQMVAVYGVSDVLLHPGFGEGFGLPILEAMSCGVPVVGTKSSTAPELIGDCGLMVDSVKYPKTNREVTFGSYNGVEFVVPNIYDAVEKLDTLYNNKTLREELGLKASVKAVQKYDWTQVMPLWFKVIEEASGASDLPAEWQELLKVADKGKKD